MLRSEAFMGYLVALALVACGGSDAAKSPATTLADNGGAATITAGSGNAQGGDTGAAPAGAGSSSAGAPQIPPQPVVGKCDNLKSGVVESIRPPFTTAYWPARFGIDQVNLGTIYVGADSFASPVGGLWKSTDCGASWVKIDTGRNSDTLDSGAQVFVIVDPITPDVVYTMSLYGANGIWKSTNGGVDFDKIWPSTNPVANERNSSTDFAAGIVMDPYDHNHLLVSFHGPCGDYNAMIGCLAETKDGGNTWGLIFRDPPNAPFESQVVAYFLDSTTWIATSDSALWRTTDSGTTWTKVADLTAGGHSAGQLYKTAAGVYYMGSFYGLIRSPDGINWSLINNTGSATFGVAGTGKTLYVSGSNNLFTSPEDDGMTWTQGMSPRDDGQGGQILYDNAHKLLYFCFGDSDGGGFYRLKVDE